MERVTYFFKTALRSVRQSAMVQLVAVSTIAVATLIFALFLTLLVNLDRLVDRWDRDLRLVVFIGADPSEEEFADLAEEIELRPGVLDVAGRTREAAFQELQRALGEEALLEGVSPEMLPASLEIRLEGPGYEESLIAYLKTMQDLGGVEEVKHAHALVERLSEWRAYLRLGALGLGGLVAFAVIFIISNTIRLTLFARREELEIMQLVGATHRFIRIPCYIEGAFQSCLGALLGLGLFYGLFRLIDLRQLGGIEICFLPLSFCMLILVGSISVGVGGSSLAVTRYLQASGPRN